MESLDELLEKLDEKLNNIEMKFESREIKFENRDRDGTWEYRASYNWRTGAPFSEPTLLAILAMILKEGAETFLSKCNLDIVEEARKILEGYPLEDCSENKKTFIDNAKQILEAVSYTHLTLPTIYSV